MNFQIRLRELREEFNITQFQLAKKINVARSNISKYESGQLGANTEIISKIADFFDVSTDYLLGKESERQPKHLSDNDKKYNFVIEKAKSGKISPEKLDKLIDALLDDK